MSRENIIRMAQEAGFKPAITSDAGIPQVWGMPTMDELERLVAIATEAERKSRQSAQIENENLKARIARAGVECSRAVSEAVKVERDACAIAGFHACVSPNESVRVRDAIRARGGAA